MRIALFALLALAQDEAVTLKYGGKVGDKTAVKGEMTITLKLDGTEDFVNMLRSSMEFLQFEKIHIRGEGERKIVKSDKKGNTEAFVEFASARVDGTFDDKPYEFDFERASPPEGLDKDKLKQICWFLSMGGPQILVDPKGTYRSSDPNKDAWSEATDVMGSGIIRFSDKPVKKGEEWTVEWKTAYKQKDNDGRFALKQKAKIEKLDGKRATIAFELTGTMEIPEAKRDKNAEKQETKLEAKGTVVIDVDTGLVRSVTSKGSIAAHYKATDPDSGAAHELKMEEGIESKYEEK